MRHRKFSVQINVRLKTENPEQMGRTGLLREQLLISVERFAEVLRCESN